MDYHNNIRALLPENCEAMLKEIETAFSCDVQVGCAALYLLKQSCLAFYDGNLTSTSKVSEQVLDHSWELLNVGHWKDVPDNSRVLYSFASLFKVLAKTGLRSDSRDDLCKEVCRLCDMALLMGTPILDGIFYKVIHIFKPCSRKRKTTNDEEEQTIKKRVQVEQNVRLRQENSIPRLTNPSLEAFQAFMKKQEPVILAGCLDHWPALNKWSVSYLKEVAGYRTVPVEVGSKYTDDEWGQRLMTVSQFIDDYIVHSDISRKGYLAQHQLFDQVPELRDDICIPDYCSLSSSPDDDVDINAWFGPPGTVSPCHFDPKHNLLAQVVGRKYIRLYHPRYSQSLYPHGGASVLTNTSQVAVENPDLSKFPKFHDTDSLYCQEHLLQPGEMLYIPPKHWHYVRSLDLSFSVSFWWE